MKPSSKNPSGRAFSLVEVLVSIGLLTIVLLVLISIVNQTSKTWSYTHGKIEEFREARTAFEDITRRLAQATLNTYWDYHYPNNDTTQAPDNYIRRSELRFVSGNASTLTGLADTVTHAVFFQAPLGFSSTYGKLDNLLNTCGYYVKYGDAQSSLPPFLSGKLPTRNRFRLMELIQPAESLTLYNYTGDTSYHGFDWFTAALNSSPAPVHILAENIVALVILPKLSANESSNAAKLAPAYLYDSTGNNMPASSLADANLNPVNQLPPVIQVTMVAIDEAAAGRLTELDNQQLESKLSGLFTSAANYAADLTLAGDAQNSLEAFLLSKKINYRIFTTNISIKGARWSREQQN